MAYFENGTESERLDNTCQACPLGSTRCPVYLVQNLFNFDQILEGKEVIMRCLHFFVDDEGACQIKRLIEEQLSPARPFPCKQEGG